jgi:hydrogenase expression/formation protein HypE
MLKGSGDGIRMMRDPTRGGLATTLKELAQEAGVCIRIKEEAVPVSDAVRGACELLGLDPLYAACEGVLVAIAKPDVAEYLLEIMRADKGNSGAGRPALIGRVEESPKGIVLLETPLGGERILDMLTGEQLPRIC